MGCTALLMEMPPTVPASQYAHLIPWGAEGLQEFLQAHIQRRFQQTGMIMDWIEEVAEEMGADNTLYRYLSDQYRSVLQLEAPLELLARDLTGIQEEEEKDEESPIPTLRKDSPMASIDSTVTQLGTSVSTSLEHSTLPEPSFARKAPDTLEPNESIDNVAPPSQHLQHHPQLSEKISEPQQTKEDHPIPPTELLLSMEDPFAMPHAQDKVAADQIAEIQHPLDEENHIRQPFQSQNYTNATTATTCTTMPHAQDKVAADQIAEIQHPLDEENHIRQPFQSQNYTNATTATTCTIIVEDLHEKVQESQETSLQESQWRHEQQQLILRLQQESIEKDQLIQQLQQELEQLQHHYNLHKTADQARLDYLLASSPPKAHLGESKTNQDVQQLAFALEVSERQRAQALDDLQEQRAFYAEKMKDLQEAFRRMIQEERLVGTPILLTKNNL
jgi:hypothetical protein